MKIEDLSLKHASLLRERLEILGDGLSEYSFSNLYFFRQVHDYKVIEDEHIFISGKTYDGASFLMPIFDPTTVDSHFLLTSLADYDFFYPISERMLTGFDPNLFSISHNIDDSDYIYDSEKLKTYHGRKLGKKKNLMKQFQMNYLVEFHPIVDKIKTDAGDVLKQWQEDTGKKTCDSDFFPCQEALSQMDQMGLLGYICYADGEPAGFILAKAVFPKICAFHFAKGKRKFKGVFQYMFNKFANCHADDFDTYNFEQDLGKLNFRKTKLSYFPDELLHKYRIKSRKEVIV